MGILAITGGSPVHTTGWIPWPVCGPEELAQLAEVLDQVQGLDRLWGGLVPCPKSTALEEKCAAYHECRYGVAVSNGAAALELALYAIGLELGDEVLTPTMTWVASATCILRAGGVPVFVDVEPETYNIDPDLLEAAITPRTKAILPVHLSGYPAQMDKIMTVAKKHGLSVVEDCAQAHGTDYRGRKVGSFGDVGIFSFQNSKFMASGEGGLIFTNDQSIWEKCHSYKDCGRLRQGNDYADYLSAFEEGGWGFGWNYRLTEFQAAVLLAQMDRLEEHKAIRVRNATWLNERLGQIKGIRPLPVHPGQNVWRYTFDYDSRAFCGLSLERFIEAMQAEGIPLNHFHPRPVHEEGLFLGYIRKPAWAPGLINNPRDYGDVQAPVADQAYREKVVFLKNNVLLGNNKDMEDIVAATTKVQQYASELVSAPQ